MTNKIKGLLDARYGLRPQRLHATVTAAPLVAGRSAGYVTATVGGVGGVRVNVDPDRRTPLTVGDTLVVQGTGTAAAMEYWADGRIAGARADSDVYQFPNGGTAGGTTMGAGDILLGSTLADWSNWWYQFELGRWQIRKGTLLTGAIGDLNNLYGYATSTYGSAFGQYSAGQVNITTDPTNGFRIRNYTTNVFQADTSGVVWALSTFRAGTGDDMVGMSATDATWRLYAGSATPASAPFRVDKDGALTATGATISGAITATTGTIAGWTVISDAIYKLDSGTPTSTPNNGITLETVGGTNSKSVIRVYDGVTLNAALGNYATGKYGVYAIEGAIGGWTIGATALTAGTGATTTGVDAGGTNPAFYAGSDVPASAPFRVTQAGALTATSGAIAGWTMISNALYKLDSGTPTSSPNNGITLETVGGTNSKSVIRTYDGATLNAALGNYADGKYGIYAIEGNIGGWTIGATALTAGTGATTTGVDAGGVNPAFYAGSATPASAPFRVTQAGALTATSGNIGGWTIGATALTAGTGATTTGVDAGGVNPAFYAGSATPASAPFRVTQAGALTATSATITGAITATSGEIAGWTVISNALYKLDSGTPTSTPNNGITFETVGGTNGKSVLRTYDGTTLNAALGNYADGKYGVYAIEGKIGGWSIGATALTAGTGATTTGVDAGGTNPAFYAGSDVPASAPFRVTQAGALTATSGTIAGLMQVGTGTPHIHIDGTSAVVESSNYASSTSGWRIASDGSAEFENITARGFIKTAVFIKSLVLAFAGSQVTSKSASVLAADCTLSGTTFTIVVKPQASSWPFQTGDLIYIKTESTATYATVGGPAAAGDNYSYTATYVSGSTSGTVYIGDTVIDYGPNGTGRVWITADDTYAPFIAIATHDMAAPPVWTERVRVGLLTGITDSETSPTGYGIWTDNGFFKGKIAASTIDIGGADTTSFHVDVAGNIWSGAAAYADGVFKVSSAGALVATSATITGALSGGTIDIGGADATSFHVDIAGNIWSGAAAYADGPFRVSSAGALDIGGADATSFHVDVAGNMWSGAAAYADGPFRVSSAGALVATSATISGAVTAATIDIGGADATSFHVDIAGNIWSGAAAYADGVFKVSNAGALVATSATITGALSGGTIDIGGADATSFHVDVAGNMWSGAAAYADGVFKVSNAGALVATSATITGAITASSGSLTGFLTLGASGGIYQGTGSAASPTTGLKIWRDGDIGRIAGYNATVLQWCADTDGKLKAGGGNVVIDAGYITITSVADVYPADGYMFTDGSAKFGGVVSNYTTTHRNVALNAESVSYNPLAEVRAQTDYNSGKTSYARLTAYTAIAGTTSTVEATATGTTGAIALNPGTGGAVTYYGDLKAYRNSTTYTGSIFVPLTTPLVSASWDGDSFSTTSKTIIDLSAVFGAPAGIKAVLMRAAVRDSDAAASDTFLVLSPNNTAYLGILYHSQPVNDRYNGTCYIVPCDANGDIYYQIAASGASTFDVILEIWGYFL